MIAAATAVFAALLASPPPQANPCRGGAVVLDTGDVAPCDGQLIPDVTLADCLNRDSRDDNATATCVADLKIAGGHLTECRAQLEIASNSCAQRIEACRAHVASCEERASKHAGDSSGTRSILTTALQITAAVASVVLFGVCVDDTTKSGACVGSAGAAGFAIGLSF
jgi:hypothetical protein